LKVAGNYLGYKHTAEAKLKISLAKLGKKLNMEIRKNISSSLKISKLVGHKHTLETKLKLSEIASKRIYNHPKNIGVSVRDTITGDIKEYKSIREAAKYLKTDTQSIRARIPAKLGIYIKPRNPLKSILFRNRYDIKPINKNSRNNR